jgi:hypothetical protein
MAWPTSEGRVTARTIAMALGTRAGDRAIEADRVELKARLEVGDGPEEDPLESAALDLVVEQVDRRLAIRGRPEESLRNRVWAAWFLGVMERRRATKKRKVVRRRPGKKTRGRAFRNPKKSSRKAG